MRRTAENSGVRFLIVLYPSQLQVYPDFRNRMLAAVKELRGYRRLAGERVDPLAPNRYLLDWCARSGADCFDLTPLLSRAAQREPRPLYIERDSHWNILGNRLAAAGEAAFLERALCPVKPPPPAGSAMTPGKPAENQSNGRGSCSSSSHTAAARARRPPASPRSAGTVCRPPAIPPQNAAASVRAGARRRACRPVRTECRSRSAGRDPSGGPRRRARPPGRRTPGIAPARGGSRTSRCRRRAAGRSGVRAHPRGGSARRR